MPRTDPNALVLTLYEERLKNDAWAIRALMDEQAVWSVMGIGASNDRAPEIGHGPAMEAFLEEILSVWRWQSYEFLDVITDESRIFCRYRLTVEHIASSKVYNAQGAEFFRLADGFIREIISYVDPQLLAIHHKDR